VLISKSSPALLLQRREQHLLLLKRGIEGDFPSVNWRGGIISKIDAIEEPQHRNLEVCQGIL